MVILEVDVLIFLLKNGKVKSLHPMMSESKVIRKFERHKDDISAVLLESDSRLRSDTYILISANHFMHSFKPFDLVYSCAYMDDDQPVIKENMMTRTAHIKTFHDMYTVASMLRSMQTSLEMTDLLGFTRFPLLISIRYMINGKEEDIWTSEAGDTLPEFFESHGIYLDADNFMDASLPEHMRVEAGHYFIRYVATEDGMRPEYYKFAKKAYLYMRDDCWALDVSDPRFYLDMDIQPEDDIKRTLTDGKYPILVGICITKTGMLYMSPLELAGALVQIGAIDIVVHCKTLAQYEHMESFGLSYSVSGSNTLDALYIALFLPQFLDFGRFIYQEDPKDISIDILFNKLQVKCKVVELPEWPQDKGIELDLFYLIAQTIVNEPLRTLTDS